MVSEKVWCKNASQQQYLHSFLYKEELRLTGKTSGWRDGEVSTRPFTQLQNRWANPWKCVKVVFAM